MDAEVELNRNRVRRTGVMTAVASFALVVLNACGGEQAHEDVTRVPTYQRLSRGLAHVLERRRLFPYMTVQENLLLGAYLPTLRAGRGRTLERVFAGDDLHQIPRGRPT